MLQTHERPETLHFVAEHTDDIPLLIAHMRRLNIPHILDNHLATRAYWSNISIGTIATIWLAHILSHGDHKLSSVQNWVATRPETLHWCIGNEVLPIDVGDDRLRDILNGLGHDEHWCNIEAELNAHLFTHHAREANQIRLNLHDSRSWHITPDGILQISQNHSWHAGVVRFHVLLATLDPYGVPLAVWSTPLRGRSEQQFSESIAQIRQALPNRQFRYVGEALAEYTMRGAVHLQGNWYLCPIDEPLPTDIRHSMENSQPTCNAEHSRVVLPNGAHEWFVPMRVELDDSAIEWNERRIMTQSLSQARLSEEALRARITRARAALMALAERKRGKRRPRTMEAMREAAEAIIDTYQVRGLLSINFDEHVEERTVRRYRGRPTAVRVERDLSISVGADEDAWARAIRRLGWQIYGTNIPAEHTLSTQTLFAAGEQERGFERLNGRPLSLPPHDLRRDEYSRGMVRLLSLGLRALSLLEIIAQQRLNDEGSTAINGRPAPQASSERLLDAFRDISLIVADEPSAWRLTPLSISQQRILNLLNLPADIYRRQ